MFLYKPRHSRIREDGILIFASFCVTQRTNFSALDNDDVRNVTGGLRKASPMPDIYAYSARKITNNKLESTKLDITFRKSWVSFKNAMQPGASKCKTLHQYVQTPRSTTYKPFHATPLRQTIHHQLRLLPVPTVNIVQQHRLRVSVVQTIAEIRLRHDAARVARSRVRLVNVLAVRNQNVTASDHVREKGSV